MCTFAESQVTCLWWTLGGHTVILMTDSRGQERVRNDTATANKGLGRWDMMNRAEVQLYLNIKYMREALKPHFFMRMRASVRSNPMFNPPSLLL